MATDVRLEGPAQNQFEKAPATIREELKALAPKLAKDPQHGEYVPPASVHNKATLKRWQARVGPVKNLYKLEMADGWRALYTVGSRGPDRVVMILEVVRHKEYERLMGYS